ncbi:MAG: hypothetical protein CTY21_09480 [Methylomonas sp.]|nr:MAG: hypothetical protein CTY21_09480 [Methylomonas sp.]
MNELDELCVGGRVRLLESIYDDDEEYGSAAGYLAMAGDVPVVRRVRVGSLSISHEGVLDNAFTVYPGEYEPYNPSGAKLELLVE